jgi:UPF0176 protein
MKILNIAAYKFVAMSEEFIRGIRYSLKNKLIELEIKGTILLSPEGINLFLAGTADAINHFKNYLAQWSEFNDLTYKESWSDEKPFSRTLVKIKREIIAFGIDTVDPEKETAPHLDPEEFKTWYEQNKDMIVLDTRNDYEVELGTFKNAIDFDLEHFRDFPNAIKFLPEEAKDKPIVTFCTGGIRCEKAAEYMLQQGFKKVYQLDGGILNYFEKCGGDYYEGECFVFDKRVAVDPKLAETTTQQCFSCRNPLPKQTADKVCPHCHTQGNMA